MQSFIYCFLSKKAIVQIKNASQYKGDRDGVRFESNTLEIFGINWWLSGRIYYKDSEHQVISAYLYRSSLPEDGLVGF